MKSYFIAILMFVALVDAYAQIPYFNFVCFGKYDNLKSQLDTTSNIKFVQDKASYVDPINRATYKMLYLEELVEMEITYSQYTNEVLSIIILYDFIEDYQTMRAKYNNLTLTIEKMLGKPTMDEKIFKDNYCDGCGGEYTAFYVEKAKFITYWKDKDIMVSVGRKKRIEIWYENPANYDLHIRTHQEKQKELYQL